MSWNYYPVLRWKQGEQIAVAKLDVADRGAMVPIAEVQALETGGQPKLEKTLRSARADAYPIAVDIKPCYLGARVPLARLARIVGRFQTAGLDVWPVLHAADAFSDVAGLAAFKGQRDLVLRIYPNDTPLVSALAIAKAVRKAMGRGGRLHAMVDLDSIGDIDPAAMAAMAVPYVRDLTPRETSLAWSWPVARFRSRWAASSSGSATFSRAASSTSGRPFVATRVVRTRRSATTA